MLRSMQPRLSHLLLVFCSYWLWAEGLQTVPGSMDLDLPESVVSNLVRVEDAPLRSSPAVVAIQDGNVVRRILRHRSSRGKVQVSSGKVVRKKSPKSTVRLEKSKAKSPSRRSSRGSEVANSAVGRPTKGIDLPYESTIEVLRIFYEKHSNLALARTTIVPAEDTFPSEWHGLDLASTVYDMKWWQKHVKQRPDRVAELNKLGFVWERLQPEWNLVLEGLVTYGILHGDLLVPAKFVIPHDDNQWPIKALWGMALGNSVYRIRNRGDFLRGNNAWSRRDQLDAIGFVYFPQEYRFQMFSNALRAFSDVEQRKRGPKRIGALKVPSQFVVPPSDEWPKELWGYKLGEKCSAVRQKELYVKGQPERLKVLADLGFRLGGKDSLSWLQVMHAAAIFSQMNRRKLEVPQNFVVPAPPRRVTNLEGSSDSYVVGSDEAWPWPEYLWGFPLGQRLRDIRLKGYYLRGKSAKARRRQLDTLGFNWTPKRGRPKSTS